MKYGKKNRGVLIRLLLLGAFSGTIAWSLLERAVSYMGVQVQMGVGMVREAHGHQLQHLNCEVRLFVTQQDEARTA